MWMPEAMLLSPNLLSRQCLAHGAPPPQPPSCQPAEAPKYQATKSLAPKQPDAPRLQNPCLPPQPLPLLSMQVQAGAEALSGVYAVLGRRRSRILSEEVGKGRSRRPPVEVADQGGPCNCC